MARDRQRAKQRRARRAQQGDGLKPSQPARENVPSELEHASGEVDQFEAALVAGADGEPAAEGATDSEGGVEHPEDLSDAAFERLEDRVDEGEAEGEGEAEVDERELDRMAQRAAVVTPASVTAPTKKGPVRFIAFLRASWAELQRVQWPDRRQVGQATAVVLGFVVVAGAYLGLADLVANEIVDFLI